MPYPEDRQGRTMAASRECISYKSKTPLASREVALLLACTQTQQNQDQLEKLRTLLTNGVNWSLLLRLASEQGVLPLVHRKLQSVDSGVVPQHILNHLTVHYCSTALLNFYLAQELLQLLSLFRSNQIPAIPYKGPVLAVSAYGSLALRQFLDLDVLIDQHDYDRSKAVLLSEGFQLLADYGWESHFISSNGGYCLDLHQGLTPRMFPYPVKFSNLWQRRRETTLCGDQVSCLSHEDSFLFLCVQVAKDSWAKQPKLAKLCDIDNFLQKHHELDWKWLLAEAGSIGAQRTLFFALALADNLLGISLPTEISNRVRTDKAIAPLVTQARNHFLKQLSTPESDSFRQADLSEQARFHSQLRERFRDRLPYRLEPLRLFGERLFIPNARDRMFLPLPEIFHFLYCLIRPIRLTCDHLLPPFIQQLRLSSKANDQRGGTEHR